MWMGGEKTVLFRAHIEEAVSVMSLEITFFVCSFR
jgi:hypothetical protein